MEEKEREQLLQIIKKDNVKAFGELLSSDLLATSFGRFPLLSLLYLFQAKHIVKKYQAELIKERPRSKEPPLREADLLFSKKAGKALRYFMEKDVSPLEMLALLGMRKELLKLYPIYPNAVRFLPSIHKIYFTRVGEGVTTVGDTLILPKELLSFSEKRFRRIVALVLFVVSIAVISTTTALSVYFGLGNNIVYYKARSEKSFVSALNQDKTIILKSDIALSGTTKAYSSKIEGDRHILSLKAPFAEKFSGEMQNVIFVLEEGFKGDAVILENEGTLKNVSVIAEGRSFEKGGEYVGLLTKINKGTIEGSTAVADVTFLGSDGGDSYFGPFAGDNQGTINNCRSECTASSLAVDLGGIAGKNSTGSITDCFVKANLQEATTIEKWNPNVGGVAAYNEGTIYGCTVTGSIISSNVCQEEDKENIPTTYAGGITCINLGTITSCKNEATVTANATFGAAISGGIAGINMSSQTGDSNGEIIKSGGKGSVLSFAKDYNAFAGGVVGQNAQNGTIENCYYKGQVSATAEKEDVFDFTGGICGRDYGIITKSFFMGTLKPYSSKSLVGGICGMAYLYGNGFTERYSIPLMDNAYLEGTGPTNGSICSYFGFEILLAGQVYTKAFFESDARYTPYIEKILEIGGTSGTESEIKAMEIYYE